MTVSRKLTDIARVLYRGGKQAYCVYKYKVIIHYIVFACEIRTIDATIIT